MVCDCLGWVRCVLAGLAMFATPAAGTVAHAAEASDASQSQGSAILRRAFQDVMIPHKSLDTTPVEFSIAGARYRIPRNYIVTMNNWAGGPQEIVTLRVSLPDLRPMSADNVACFERDPARRTAPCQPFEFSLGLPPMVTAEQAFANARKNSFENQNPSVGPDSFQKYSYGGEANRTDEYIKRSPTDVTFFTCNLISKTDTFSFCNSTWNVAKSGSSLHFFFSSNDFPLIPKAEEGLRNLIDSFVINKKEDIR